MKYDDMLVETEVPLTSMDRLTFRPGHPGQSRCTYCGRQAMDNWYPVEDLTVVRHWNIDSVDEPGGGHWTWYCPRHLERRNGNWWKSSHLAPARLLPEIKHDCQHVFGLTMKCGDPAVEPFDGVWLCETHAVSARLKRDQLALFLDHDPEDLLG